MKKMILTWYLLGSFGQSQQATIGHQRIKGGDGVRQSTDLVGHHGGHLGETNEMSVFSMRSYAYPRENTGLSTLQKALLSVVTISAAVGLFGDKDNITEGFLDTFFGKRTLQLWSILLFFHCIFDQTDDPANTCMGLYFANSIINKN